MSNTDKVCICVPVRFAQTATRHLTLLAAMGLLLPWGEVVLSAIPGSGIHQASILAAQQGSTSLRIDLTSSKPKTTSTSLRLNFNNNPVRSSSSTSLRLNINEISQRLGVQQVGEASAVRERRVPVKPVLTGPQADIAKADTLLDQDKIEEAVALYKKVITKSPKLVEAHMGLGDALMKQGDFEEAAKKYQEATEIAPTNPDVALGFGVALYRSGRIEEAISQYKLVLEKEKDYAPVYYNLGIAYAHRGEFDEAIKEYQTAITLRKKNYPDAANNLGLIYEAIGNVQGATEQFKAAIAQRPNYPLAHYNLARCYMGQARFDEALTETKTAVQQQTNFSEAYLTLGNLYLIRSLLRDTNEQELAITAFKQAIQLRENFYPIAHENLAIAYTLKGDDKSAYAEYRLAMDQEDGKSPQTMRNLLSTMLGNRDKFIIDNEQSRSANPGNLKSKARKVSQKDTKDTRQTDDDAVRQELLNVLIDYDDIAAEAKENADLRYCAGRAYMAVGGIGGAIGEMAEAYRLSGEKDLDAGKTLTYLISWLHQ
ncbi:MAG TPA: tetratricopeptide repeat protein [Acidobacteriota bacterium]|nr:tetratricopeptide repeat protein [Acidobacteriota bacterium]